MLGGMSSRQPSPSKQRIVNARIVNEGLCAEGELLIENGRIAALGAACGGDAPVFDAQGAWLLPGMIDDQAHFREPGFPRKGTIATESRAALVGGITSYMEMPNSNPQTINRAALEDKHRRAAAHSAANYGFYLGATNDNLEEIKSADPARVCGIKVFMGASTGDMLVDDPQALAGIFASTPLVIATHCEDTPSILANEARARERYGDRIPFAEHPNIRSAEACFKSSALAVELAKRHGAKLHVLHLTTAREMELFAPGDLAGKRITAEACIHHLYFDASWYAEKGVQIKCNPAIKQASDRAALLAAVRDGRIDIIATDHAPHAWEEKARPYLEAPAGLPVAQHALPCLCEHLNPNGGGALSLELIVAKTAHAPAELFAVRERGFLREGYYADLVLLEEAPLAGDANLLSKCGWSPFAGIEFRHRVRATWVNGRLRQLDGRILDGPPGQALEFER